MAAFKEQFMAAWGRLSDLNRPLRLLLILAGIIASSALLLWILDRVFLYVLSVQYVDELARVFDLNVGAARALTWAAFGATIFFAGYVFSFSRSKRWFGLSGLLLLLIGHSLLIWYATREKKFDAAGNAIKCYVVTRDDIYVREHVGIDPVSGRECRPITPPVAERLEKYKGGNRPKRIDVSDPVFFEPRTGEPIIWYAKSKANVIELFDLMGYHPESGEELLPVTKEIVEEWKTQREREARRPPERIDPKTFAFFDPVTGNPRVWFYKNENGDFEFYDRPGFHSRSGEPFTLITRDIVDEWEKKQKEFASQRCFIITRDAVRYGDRPGIDPATGRSCQPLTAELLERLREYEKGNRPRRILSENPTFFDLRTGEPIVWYYRNSSGQIEIFDLMGFHPETGEELLPVSRAVVDTWKAQQVERQQEKVRKPPQRIDPDKYAFFDPITGKPRVWYWRSEKGEYEFYDNAGFHPRTGEPLTIISREAIVKWKSDLEEQEQRRKQEQIEQEREKKRTEEERQKRLEEERIKHAAELAKIEQEKKAGENCDQLAANPRDPRRPLDVVGVPYDQLKNQAKDAIDSCARAVQQKPNELRYQYQLARALEFSNLDRALELHLKLTRLQYPAAFDNAGGLLVRKRRYAEAVQLFQIGSQLGDPDAMVSLAEMIKTGHAQGNYVLLYQKAASLGHEGARRALEIEQQQQIELQEQRQREMEAQRRGMEMMGTILRMIPRR